MKKSLLFSAVSIFCMTTANATTSFTGIIYWHADDCQWCTMWETSDRRQEFYEHLGNNHLQIISVKKLYVSDPDTDYLWPNDIPDFQELQSGDKPPANVPSFDFICNGIKVKRIIGVANWDSFWLKETDHLLTYCNTNI